MVIDMNYSEGFRRIVYATFALIFISIPISKNYSYAYLISLFNNLDSIVRSIVIGVSVGLAVSCLGWIINGFSDAE